MAITAWPLGPVWQGTVVRRWPRSSSAQTSTWSAANGTVISGAGQTKSRAYYANALTVQVLENHGQIHVKHSDTGQPLAKVYVKVYAQMQDGTVKFYKDGYTDLRGRFDYTSLSTNELDFVKKFSPLVLSEEHGAVVREGRPPQR
jgi:hypothetical protein